VGNWLRSPRPMLSARSLNEGNGRADNPFEVAMSSLTSSWAAPLVGGHLVAEWSEPKQVTTSEERSDIRTTEECRCPRPSTTSL
jgi:hypothetical protein